MPISAVLFFVSLTGIFLIDIFSRPQWQNTSLLLISVIPFFLFLLAKIEKKKILIPRSALFYAGFIFFTLISAFFSLDRQVSVERTLVYVSAFGFFIYAYTYKDILANHWKKFVIFLSLTTVVLILLNHFLKLSLFAEGLSLYYFNDHSQWGNLLLIALIMVFPSFLSFVFLGFIVLSSSRTAYLAGISMIFVRTLNHLKDRKSLFLASVFILVLLLSLFFASKNILLGKYKTLLGRRPVYFSYAAESIKASPLFGVGPGNFHYASAVRQTMEYEDTSSAHNIFLDILAENGVIAGVFFILFLLSIFRSITLKDRNALAFIGLTFVFITDFSYLYGTFLVIWFVIAGLIEKEKNPLQPKTGLILWVIPLLIGQNIFVSNLLLDTGYWREALILYPLNQEAYAKGIERLMEEKKFDEADTNLKQYEKLFGNSFKTLYTATDYYQKTNQKDKTIAVYEKILGLRPFELVRLKDDLIKRYLQRYGRVKGEERYLRTVEKIKSRFTEQQQSSLVKLIDDIMNKSDHLPPLYVEGGLIKRGDTNVPVQLKGVSSKLFVYEYGGEGNQFIVELLMEALDVAAKWNINMVGLFINPDNIALHEEKLDAVIDWAERNNIYVYLMPCVNIADKDKTTMAQVKEFPDMMGRLAKKYYLKTNVIYGFWAEPTGVSWEELVELVNETAGRILAENEDAVMLLTGINFSRVIELNANFPYRNLIYDFHDYPAASPEKVASALAGQKDFSWAKFIGKRPILIGEFGGVWETGFSSQEDLNYMKKVIDNVNKNGLHYSAYTIDREEGLGLINWYTGQPTEKGKIIKDDLATHPPTDFGK